MKRDLILSWLDKIVSTQVGSEIYLPAENRKHRKFLFKEFDKELKVLAEIDPHKAGMIRLREETKDHKLWLVLERQCSAPLTGFIKGPDGSIQRTTIQDPGRLRRISLMKQDGYSKEEIEKLEGELTEDECQLIGEEK